VTTDEPVPRELVERIASSEGFFEGRTVTL
jgi:hypothetical protein